MSRVEGELSSVLGVLATGRNQGKLEGFTINMTSLDDIFLEVNNFTLFDNVQVLMIEVTMWYKEEKGQVPLLQVTSGGETRRLGTGETGQALAEEGEGNQVN